MKKYTLYLTVLLAASLGFFTVQSCKKSSNSKTTTTTSQPTVQPTDANALTGVLVVKGATKKDGDFPAQSSSPDRPVITIADSAVSSTVGSDVWLYIQYASSGVPVEGVYLQVAGATSYFSVPVTATETADGMMALAVTVPSNVAEGTFTLKMALYNANGVSNTFETAVTAATPKTCDFKRHADRERVSSMTYHMGDKAGKVTIEYFPYGQALRIDIYQNGKWVGGTDAASPGNSGHVPQMLNCGYMIKGYTTAQGRIGIIYEPSEGKDITVLATGGCQFDHPIWTYTISCPEQDYTESKPDYGWVSMNGKVYHVYDWLGDSSSSGIGLTVFLDSAVGTTGDRLNFHVLDNHGLNWLDTIGNTTMEFYDASEPSLSYQHYYSKYAKPQPGYFTLDYPNIVVSEDDLNHNKRLKRVGGSFSAKMQTDFFGPYRTKEFEGTFELYH